MFFKKALLVLALTLVGMGVSFTPVAAQSSADQNQIGYLSTSGCTPSTSTPCFIQYGATLPVSGSITATNPSVGTNAVAAPTSSTQIGSVDGSGNLQPASSTNPVPTSVASLPLPTGASTSALQSNIQSNAGIGTTTAITIQGNSGGIPIPVSGALTPSATVGLSTQACTVACASTIVSGAHSLYDVQFSATVTGTLFLYDATSCPANGTVTPKKAFAYTVANSNIGVSWGGIPVIQATGIALCFSSSGPYTATASTTAYISADYK